METNNDKVNKGGVKTEEGKAITKYNATKHGLLSKEVLLDDEDGNQLDDLYKSCHEVFAPVGKFEEILVDKIVACLWRQRRAIVVERNAMEYEREDQTSIALGFGGDNTKKGEKAMIDNDVIEKLLRYETTIERSMYRAIHELNRLQAERMGKVVPQTLYANIDINKDEGFVSQN
jgi:hypothetical protein